MAAPQSLLSYLYTTLGTTTTTANTAAGQAAAALTAANAAAGAFTMTGTSFNLSTAVPADYSAALATKNIVVFSSTDATQTITIPAAADGTGYAGPYRVYNDNDPTVEGALSIAFVSNDNTPVSLANTVAPGTNVTLVWNATQLKWFSLLG
jgi:hypothetical protein